MALDARARILLVEGVPGIGKSTLADGLVRHYVNAEAAGRLRTVFALAQTHTYGPLAHGEDDGTLTRAQNLSHIDRIVASLEWLAEHARGQNRPKTFIIVDTLHLTHCLRPGVVKWEDVIDCDERLAAIGGKLLLLDADDETIATRTVRARAATEFIRAYALGRFGRDDEELIAHFCRERDAFRQMFERSRLAKARLAAERLPHDLVNEAAAFWLR